MTGVRHGVEVKEHSKWSHSRYDRERQAGKVESVKPRKERLPEIIITQKLWFLLNSHVISSSWLYCIAAVGVGAQEAIQHY